MKRVLLLTDSLGCPRKETNVDNTWVDRILKAFQGRDIFYTMCIHGLDVRQVKSMMWCIRELEPDIIIVQLGIVDASRRALTRIELKVLQVLPFRNCIRKLISKHHYRMTKIRNIHYATKHELRECIEELIGIAREKLGWIRIVGGQGLETQCYNLSKDIEDYNNEINLIKNEEFTVIDPYSNVDNCDGILLSDGHHLNFQGEELCFQYVNSFLCECIDE